MFINLSSHRIGSRLDAEADASKTRQTLMGVSTSANTFADPLSDVATIIMVKLSSARHRNVLCIGYRMAWMCFGAAMLGWRLHCVLSLSLILPSNGTRIARRAVVVVPTCCRYNDVDGVNTLAPIEGDAVTRRFCQTLRRVPGLCVSKWKQSICPDTRRPSFELNSDVSHSHVC